MDVRTKLSDKQKSSIRQLLYLPYILRDILFCHWKGVTWYPDWRFYGLPYISIAGRGSSIVIGRRFIACSNLTHNSLGVFQPVILKTVGHGAKITMGDDVGISGSTLSAATAITIGNHVLVGSGCLINDTDSHPVDPEARRRGECAISKPIVIEDDVFVGARVIILKGVTIGKGSVVGAGAVVAKSVPPYSIVAGNPAKVVGSSKRQKA